MGKFILVLLLAQVSFADSSFYYFEDYRLEKTAVSNKAASGYYAYESIPWPNGIVPVEFDRSISKDYRNRFMSACKVWSAAGKVQCRVRQSTDQTYLYVSDDEANCWTEVGAGRSPGRREFNFQHAWCWERDKLIHEIGHVLGFMHEHQRPDRDKYIKVYPENAGQFAFAYQRLSFGSLDKSSSYDFMSIMHYWNKAYSVNGRAIMVPRAGYERYTDTMGTSKALTKGDRDLVRRVYGVK